MTSGQTGSNRPRCQCGTRLARDNRNGLCAACRHKIRDRIITPPQVPASFWDEPAMREALAQRHIGKVIRAFRLHPHHPKPISQQVAAGWLDTTQAQLSRMETRHRTKDLDILMQVAHILHIPHAFLWFAPPPAPNEESTETRAAAIPNPPGSVIPTFEIPAGIEDDVNRRQALQAAGAVTAGIAATPVLDALTSAWQASQPRIPGATLSHAMIEDWALGFAVHLRSHATDRPEDTLKGLAHDWSEMAPHLAATQPEGVRQDLSHVAAQYSYLIAMGFHQVNNLRMADRWWRTAHRHADASSDSTLSSQTRSWETAYQVVEPGADLLALVATAQSARERAGTRPSGALIQAIRVEAEVFAWMGRDSDAVATIREAEDVFERLPSGEVRAEKHLRFGQSLIYSATGATNRAAEAQDAAHRLYPLHEDPCTSAQLSLHTARLHSRTDPGEASRQALAVLDEVPAHRRVKRVVLAARRVADAVPEDARSLPSVRELQALTA